LDSLNQHTSGYLIELIVRTVRVRQRLAR
jgi:hypothetical protein